MPTAAATSLRAAARLVELRHVKFLQRRFQLLVRRGQVLQQLDVPIKMDDEGLVLFRTHQVVQEAIAGRALLLQHASLTHAGVNQQTKRERQVRIFGEVTDGLRMAVLLQLEVVLGQVVDDLAVLVAHRGQHVDHLDVGGKRRRFLAGGRLLTRRRLLAWQQCDARSSGHWTPLSEKILRMNCRRNCGVSATSTNPIEPQKLPECDSAEILELEVTKS